MGCHWRGNYFLKTRFYSRVSLRPAQYTHIVNDPSGAKKGKMSIVSKLQFIVLILLLILIIETERKEISTARIARASGFFVFIHWRALINPGRE